MIQYQYQEGINIETLNDLGSEGWSVVDVLEGATPSTFNVLLSEGFEDKTLITNSETGARVWINEGFNYADAFLIFVIVAFTVVFGVRSVYKFIFQQQ